MKLTVIGKTVACILIAIMLMGCGSTDLNHENKISLDGKHSYNADLVEKIKEGLKNHSASITVSFEEEKDILSDIPSLADEWMEEAMAESELSNEGDYIRYQLGGWESESSYKREGKKFNYKVRLIPKYYMYLSQEEAVTEKIDELIEELGLKEKGSEYDKALAIYDWFCKNVKYDNFHRKNKYYFLRSTAWAALIKQSATCQGYAVAMYRLMKEAGIDCRIIRGSSKDDKLHAWNIVRIDGCYYYADATWDSVWTTDGNWQYFLKGSKSFEEYEPEDGFSKGDFADMYPVSETDHSD